MEEDNNDNDYNINVKWEDIGNNKENKKGDTEKPQETLDNIIVQQVWPVNDCAKTVLWADNAAKVAVAVSSNPKQ